MTTSLSGFTIIAEITNGTTARSADQDWFASDINFATLGIVIPVGMAPFLHVNFSYSAASIIEFTNDGTNYAPIGNNIAINGRAFKSTTIRVGDTFNLRAKTGGNVFFCRILLET